MKYLPLFLALFLVSCGSEPTRSDLEYDHKMKILQIMEDQEQAWNNADIEGFMKAYERSDSLLFIGSSGPSMAMTRCLVIIKRHILGKRAWDS